MMRVQISICYHIDVDISGLKFPAGCNTPEQRMQYEIERAERDPFRFVGNAAPVVNGKLAPRASSDFSEPY